MIEYKGWFKGHAQPGLSVVLCFLTDFFFSSKYWCLLLGLQG